MHVTLIAAQSLDGLITRHEIPGSSFTSPEDKIHFSRALQAFDCRVMGATTYRTLREITRRTASSKHLQVVLTRTPDTFSSDVIPGALEFSRLAPPELLKSLEREGRKTCALIGGSQVHSLFLEAGCVDELWLTIEPTLFGTGTRLLSRTTDTKLSLLTHELLSPDTLLLKYQVLR